jgi:multiple sugar transport system permease protein
MSTTDISRSVGVHPPRDVNKGFTMSVHRRQQIWGIIFLSPWIFGFIAFTLLPIVTSLGLSFTNYQLNSEDPVRFVGFENYSRIFVDPITEFSFNPENVGISLNPPRVHTGIHLGQAFTSTLTFAAIALPLGIVLPVLLAALMNSKHLVGKRIFRTLFYMPYMVPVVSAVAIWGGMLNSEAGWINRFLNLFGVIGPDWLNDIGWIYPAMNIIGLWGIGNAFLITLAAMQGVPTELYEAATVDGAGSFRRFRHITLPMISPVIFYNLVLSIIGLLRYFEIPYILSQGTGRPGGATMFYSIHLYKTAFVFNDMSYGSALAWLLFAIGFVATLLLFLSSRYWVYYSSGETF